MPAGKAIGRPARRVQQGAGSIGGETGADSGDRMELAVCGRGRYNAPIPFRTSRRNRFNGNGTVTGRASSLLHRMSASPLQAFQQAVALHDQGRLWEAERLYQVVLPADDRHFVALCRLGLLRLQQSRFDDAVRLFRRAVKVDRNSAEAHQYLGFALTGLERSEEAVRSFQKALALKPAFAEARNNFGHALQKLGRLDPAHAPF